MGRLDGKVTLVTGGGRGIGRGIVVEFAREGADVAINHRRGRDAADATARDVEALGRRAVVVQADVSDISSVGADVAAARRCALPRGEGRREHEQGRRIHTGVPMLTAQMDLLRFMGAE